MIFHFIFLGIIYGNGTYLVLADSGFVFASRDGGKTFKVGRAALTDIKAAYGKGLFVGIVYDGNEILISEDGVSWKSVYESNVRLSSVKYFDKHQLFVVVGREGEVLFSADGINWQREERVTTTDLIDVAVVENGDLIVVGEIGIVLRGRRKWN